MHFLVSYEVPYDNGPIEWNDDDDNNRMKSIWVGVLQLLCQI